MHAAITIVRYKKRFIYFAVSAMGIHSLYLKLKKNIRFHKTLGCGKGGTFSKTPDWQQWGLLAVKDQMNDQIYTDTPHHQLIKEIYGSFIAGWYQFFGCELWTVILEPIEGHGTWNNKKAFGDLPPKTGYEGMIAVLTRASIRPQQLHRFWEHVQGAADEMNKADGFLFSLGIGESLRLKQATLSFWQSKAQMKTFAYKMQHHKEIVQKTKAENWYSEDMFVRFKVVKVKGSILGKEPLTLSEE
ncbi:MAG TPA: spheroidene monooxygenase [Lacibacter sp.]|nr:spheroidene monooxygenase [Lacibacter sp.]